MRRLSETDGCFRKVFDVSRTMSVLKFVWKEAHDEAPQLGWSTSNGESFSSSLATRVDGVGGLHVSMAVIG